MAESPITLHAGEVARAALKAMDEGRLQLQAVSYGGKSWCQYGTHDCCCAIGAALPEDVAREWDSLDDTEISEIFEREIALPYTYEHYPYIDRMQAKHDNLIQLVEAGAISLQSAIKSMRTHLGEVSEKFPT